MVIIAQYLGLDKNNFPPYNGENFIGQFVTILSVNKTREPDGRFALIFFVGADCVHFILERFS